MASRVTEKGYQFGVAALRKRRAEIAGDIGQLQVQVRHRRRDLKRVDDILRILAPSSDPTAIPAKKPLKHLNVFRQGQLNALILGILAASKTPMTNIEVLEALMAKIGSPPASRQALRRRVNGNLAYLGKAGRVAKAATGLWALGGAKPETKNPG
jgi:hypothetical protein